MELAAQAPSNQSLNGTYAFREILLGADSGQSQTAFGTLTFTGDGKFTFTGQQLAGSAAPSSLSGTGTYAVQSSGMFTLTDPLRTSSSINGRLGSSALVGSDTEGGNNVVGIFVAVAAPASPITSTAIRTSPARPCSSSLRTEAGG
jgi:hypothetical protein